MPMYDYKCPECGYVEIDVLTKMAKRVLPCPVCPAGMERVWLTRGPTVIPDSIPGGIMIHNGICNEDGTPRRYDSKSEMKREAKQRGVQQRVEHIPPDPGSDKAKRPDGKVTTTRWI